MVATWWAGDCGDRSRLVQGMEVSPLVIVNISLCNDQNDGRGAASIFSPPNTQGRKRVSTVVEDHVTVAREVGRRYVFIVKDDITTTGLFQGDGEHLLTYRHIFEAIKLVGGECTNGVVCTACLPAR